MSLWTIQENNKSYFDLYRDGIKLNKTDLKDSGICINYIVTYANPFDLIVAGKDIFFIYNRGNQCLN